METSLTPVSGFVASCFGIFFSPFCEVTLREVTFEFQGDEQICSSLKNVATLMPLECETSGVCLIPNESAATHQGCFAGRRADVNAMPEKKPLTVYNQRLSVYNRGRKDGPANDSGRRAA
jgi:hypothetical protein